MKILFASFLLVFILSTTLCFFASSIHAAEDEVAAVAAGGGDAAVSIPRKRSIFQACHKDIDALCLKPAEGKKLLDPPTRRRRMKEAASCLDENQSEIKEETCKAWIKARSVCFADAEKEGVCDSDPKYKERIDGGKKKGKELSPEDAVRLKRMATMYCLRTLDSSKFSTECSSTDFFKSIVGLRRFHNSIKKEAEKKKKQEKLKAVADQVAHI